MLHCPRSDGHFDLFARVIMSSVSCISSNSCYLFIENKILPVLKTCIDKITQVAVEAFSKIKNLYLSFERWSNATNLKIFAIACCGALALLFVYALLKVSLSNKTKIVHTKQNHPYNHVTPGRRKRPRVEHPLPVAPSKPCVGGQGATTTQRKGT